MIDLFSIVPIRMQGISGGFLQSQVQIHDRDLFTGLFHFTDENTEHILFFLQGKRVALYRLGDGFWEALSPMLWDDVIAAPRGDLRVLTLPLDGLRLYRLLLESDMTEAFVSREMPAMEVVKYFSSIPDEGRMAISVVQHNENNVILLLSPNRSSPIVEGIFLTASGAQMTQGMANQLSAWGERQCKVWLCKHNPWSESWKEFDLRNVFSSLFKTMVTRYEELAGHFLVSDLAEQLNIECNSHMWVINMQGSDLSNRHFFENFESAARTYAALLDIVDKEMAMVIGPKLTNQILQDALMQTSSEARQLLREQVMSRSQLGSNMFAGIGEV